MKTTCVAPRLIASMPTAPVPAKTSRKREPATLGPRTLKGVSLERFEDAAAIFAGDDAHIGLANFGQMISPLPLAGEAAQEAVQDKLLRRGVGDGEGFAAGLLQEFAVAQWVSDVEAEGSGLAGAEEFAGADASPELMELGKAKTLGVFDNHHGGIGNVDADFYDGGGDQDLQFVFAE